MDVRPLLRTSARSLLRRPAYTLLVTLTLAIAVGGSTGVFTLVNGVLLESLPFAQADRLVTIEPQNVSTGFFHSLSIPDYRDWRDRSRGFEAFGASAGWTFVRQSADGAERLEGRAVLGDFFEVLGLEAEHGRLFGAPETEAGAEAVVVVGHALFERVLDGDPGRLGSALVLDGRPYTVVGVLPAGAGYPSAEADFYVPMGTEAESLPWNERDSSFGTRAVARLAPGVTVSAAQADMDRVTGEVDAMIGRPHVRTRVRTLEELFLGDVAQALWVLMGAVTLLLLIAGANVANLALARGEGRRGEVALRRALGAGEGSVLALLLAESAWVTLLGGGLGVLIALGIVAALPALVPVEIPTLVAGQVGMHRPVLLFALAVSAGCGALFGLLPALGSVRDGDLRQGGRATESRRAGRFRDGLVVAQVALSAVLLVGAGLLTRSLDRIARVDKGFDATGVVTARLRTPPGTWEDREDWLAFNDALLAELEAAAEVERAAATLLLPLTGRSWEQRIWPEGVVRTRETGASVLFNVVSEGYFEALGVRLVAGRPFLPSDVDGGPAVAIVDETMAERFWPGEDPLGKIVSLVLEEDGDPEWRTVVGVAANTRHYELESASRIQIYYPMRQAGRYSGISMSVAVRTRVGADAAVARTLRTTVARLEPGTPVTDLRTLDEYVAERTSARRALGTVTSAFGGLAALLACLGIFGVLTLAVLRRRRELGIRLAIGAAPESVVALVVRRGLALAATGIVLGVVGAGVAGRAIQAVLFEVTPWHPGSYLVAVALLLTAALGAAAAPALRAAATAPTEVLRAD